ncbi:MAG: glycosyltransferase [Patescibacteria group bacterium]
MLKALYALQNSFVKLLIIGDGPYRSYLENYVTSRNLSEQVTFKGKLSHVEAMQTLLDADVYVLPTLRVEGFPMTLPEAMFARLPLIVSDLGGNKEAIEEGKNGYIVPAGDVLALIEKINSFVDNRNLVISMGDYSYKKASSEFSIDEMLNSYIEIIKKITK